MPRFIIFQLLKTEDLKNLKNRLCTEQRKEL